MARRLKLEAELPLTRCNPGKSAMTIQSKPMFVSPASTAWLAARIETFSGRIAALVNRSPAAMVGTGALILLTLLWASNLTQTELDRDRTLESARRSDANLTRLFAEHTLRTLKGADQVLLLIKQDYEKHNGRIELADYSRDGVVVGRIFNQLGIIDENGMNVAGSRSDAREPGYSEREHFKWHQARDSGELRVGKPLAGRTAGSWSIELTRRLNKSDGSFGGVASIAVDSQYLSQVYADLDLGRDSVAMLVGTDAIVRAGYASGLASAGQDIRASLLFEHVKLGDAGSFRSVGDGDGGGRQMSYRKLVDYPLVVALGRRDEEVFRQFSVRQSRDFTAGMVSSLLILISAILAVRLIRFRSAGR